MAENNRANRTNRTREHFISECRDNRIVIDAGLSRRIYQIYRRHFDGFSRSVYLVRYYSQYLRDAGVEEAIVKEIASLIDDVIEKLNKKIAISDQIIEKENIKTKPPQHEKTSVTIVDPLANRFLKAFILAQILDDKVSALWLATYLDDSQRNLALSDIESDLRTIQSKSRIISLGVRDRVKGQGQAAPSTTESTGEIDETETEVEAEQLAEDILD